LGATSIDEPSPDLIRQTLASLRQASAAVDEIHDRELSDDSATSMVEAFERAADVAVSTERRIRTTQAG
jgi:hypothetical protein